MERLLSCDCGGSLAVLPKQAGQQVPCPRCQKMLQVPTLRGLADLPLAATSGPTNSGASNRNLWRIRGPLLAICLLGCFAFGLSAAYYYYYFTAFEVTMDMEKQVQMDQERIEQAGLDALNFAWDSYTTFAPREKSPPEYKIWSDYQSELGGNSRLMAILSGGFGIAAALTWLSAKLSRKV